MSLKEKDLEYKEDHHSKAFLDPKHEWRRLFAEVWGTFLLVIAGAGAAMVGKLTSDVSLAMQVIAPGLTVMVVIYFMGSVSGAHLNPVVTLAFSLRRHFPWRRVPGYWLSQLAGGLLAVLFLRFLLGTIGELGATIPKDLTPWKAYALETMLTTGLVNTILGTASGPRNVGPNGAIAVGSYIAVAGLWAGHLTGASMNPVRSLAPDIVRGDFNTFWIYLLATLTGALLAVGFEWILKGKPSKHASLEAQGEGT
jgi:aquaporin Z